jgi:hypothetical protein
MAWQSDHSLVLRSTMRAHLFLLAAVALSVVGACERPKPAASASAVPEPQAANRDTAPPLPAVSQASAQRPGMPMVFPRTCEGEDCGVEFPALACAAVEFRSAAADTAPVVAHVAKGDTVNVRSIDLHVTEPGLVVLRRDFALDWADAGEGRFPAAATLRYAAGDTVYLLHYNELGSWTWWYRGSVQSGNEFWAGPAHERLGGVTRSRDSSVAVARSHPWRETWWRVELPSGASGWWRADTLYSLLSIPWMQHWGETGCLPSK